MGGELDEKYPNLTVDVHHPELTVYLEVRDYAAYVHADPEPGAGGLPVGVGGRAVSLLSGGIDSPVASWMIAMRATTAVTTLPILRPVVGMDKEEIVRIARRINTFETSILPYEDCCTVFTPRHPRLRPVLGELEAAEAALDVEGLVKAAVDGIERVQV